MESPRSWICFDEPDEAYLAAAALRRYRDGSIDAILIPSDRGPAIDIASGALSDSLVRALVRRFGGRIEAAEVDIGDETRAGLDIGAEQAADESPGASQRLHSSLL